MKAQSKNSMPAYALAGVTAIVVAVIAIAGLNALGMVSGTATVTVQSSVAISMPVNSINFGTLYEGGTNNTLGTVPVPFKVQNDGNVKVNITINATSIFSTALNPASNYQYEANVTVPGEGTCFDITQSTMTLTNMPASNNPTKFMTYLNDTNTCDEAEVEVQVTVPVGEPAGAKTSTVTLIGSQA